MKNIITVSIIIVNWNTRELINNCIKSILDFCKGVTYEIIIVDNASSDGSSSFIKREYPGIKLLENSVNLGFAKACNQAVKISSGRYIFLLNPDTFLNRGVISGLINFMDKLDWAGIAGPQIIDRKGNITDSVRKFPTMWRTLLKKTILGKLFPWARVTKLIKVISMDRVSIVDNVSGGALLIKREIWDALDGMDERFFMFYEDVDICRRVKNMGYNVYYVPSIKLMHIGGGSRRKARSLAFYYSLESRIIYFEKFYPKPAVLLFKYAYKPLFLMRVARDLLLNPFNRCVYEERAGFFKKYFFDFLKL